MPIKTGFLLIKTLRIGDTTFPVAIRVFKSREQAKRFVSSRVVQTDLVIDPIPVEGF
jgi:hypothetical protein